MEQKEYLEVLAKLHFIPQVILELDLQGFIEAIDLAETLCPIVDQTLYMKYIHDSGSDYLDFMKRLAEALKPFQDEIKAAMKAKGVEG